MLYAAAAVSFLVRYFIFLPHCWRRILRLLAIDHPSQNLGLSFSGKLSNHERM